jgi:hypothetical protein
VEREPIRSAERFGCRVDVVVAIIVGAEFEWPSTARPPRYRRDTDAWSTAIMTTINHGRPFSRHLVAGIVLLACATAGCGSDDNAVGTTTTQSEVAAPVSTPSSAQPDDPGLVLAVIGDSYAGTGWVEEYRAHLESTLGQPVHAEQIDGMGVPEALASVSTEGTRTEQVLADADVIIVETGFNNAFPDPDTGIGCGGTLDNGAMPFIRSTDPECLEEGVATYGALYDDIFARLRELRVGQPTVFIATGTIDGNIDPDNGGVINDGGVGPADEAEALAWTVAAYDRWNTMLADRATQAGFTFVDIYHAFNGPDGTEPIPPELQGEVEHLSPRGNAVFAELLSEVDVSQLG